MQGTDTKYLFMQLCSATELTLFVFQLSWQLLQQCVRCHQTIALVLFCCLAGPGAAIEPVTKPYYGAASGQAWRSGSRAAWARSSRSRVACMCASSRRSSSSSAW